MSCLTISQKWKAQKWQKSQNNSVWEATEITFFSGYKGEKNLQTAQRFNLLIDPLRVPPQHFNQVEVWTLTGPFQNLDSFLFHTFCCWFAAVSWIIVLLMIQFQPSFSCQTDGLRFDSRILLYTGVNCQLNDCKVSRSCGCKTCPHHYLSSTMLDGWYEFALICCVWR